MASSTKGTFVMAGMAAGQATFFTDVVPPRVRTLAICAALFFSGVFFVPAENVLRGQMVCLLAMCATLDLDVCWHLDVWHLDVCWHLDVVVCHLDVVVCHCL